MSKRIVVVEDQFGTPNWKKVRSEMPIFIGFLTGDFRGA
jgi:hypothetical protein